MTAYRFVTLTCDICGAVWDYGITLKVREARAIAAGQGWAKVGRSGDRCGGCSSTRERQGQSMESADA